MDKSKPILVTGATGYIAGWIIERLLNQGYNVHATVRDPSKKNKIQHLYDIAEKSSGKIKFSIYMTLQKSHLEKFNFSKQIYSKHILLMNPCKDVKSSFIPLPLSL